MWSHVVAFVSNIWGHFSTLIAGCVATFLIGIIEKHVLKKPLSITAEVAMLLAFLFVACFQAWQDAYMSMKGREADLHNTEMRALELSRTIEAQHERIAKLQDDALVLSARPYISPEVAKVRTALSALLADGNAVLDKCRTGPTPECAKDRHQWENAVTKTLKTYRDPYPASRWASYVRQQDIGGPPFIAVSNEALILAGIINDLK